MQFTKSHFVIFLLAFSASLPNADTANADVITKLTSGLVDYSAVVFAFPVNEPEILWNPMISGALDFSASFSEENIHFAAQARGDFTEAYTSNNLTLASSILLDVEHGGTDLVLNSVGRSISFFEVNGLASAILDIQMQSEFDYLCHVLLTDGVKAIYEDVLMSPTTVAIDGLSGEYQLQISLVRDSPPITQRSERHLVVASASMTLSSVPEPTSITLLGAASVIALGVTARAKRKSKARKSVVGG